MKCLILCGGNGVIDPETRTRIPKCLLKIGNRPIIWHVMKSYSYYGFKEFILALGYGSEKVKEYFSNSFELMHDIEIDLSANAIKKLNHIPEENWNIKLVDTGLSARTGARISRCERFLKHEDFLIAYSDVLSDVNILDSIRSHQESKKILTITGVNPTSRFGSFTMENNALNYSFGDNIKMSNSCINGGFMVADKSILQILNPMNECNLETEIFQQLTDAGQVNIHRHHGFWQNIDTERDLNYIQSIYSENKRPWLGIN